MTRRAGTSTVVDGRQYAVEVSAFGSKITFECARAGHRYTQDFGKGPRHRRLEGVGLRLMARWWSREGGGCIGPCPKCRRKGATT